MSAKMANTFYDTLLILDVLSMAGEGMTTGQIAKGLNACSVGQVKRMITSLEMCGFIHGETKPHGRTGKTVYHMNEQASVMLSSVSRQYVEKH